MIAGDIEVMRQFVHTPGTRPAVPEEQKSFEMGNAVDLIEDEVIDVTMGRFLFFRSAAEVQRRIC